MSIPLERLKTVTKWRLASRAGFRAIGWAALLPAAWVAVRRAHTGERSLLRER